MRRGDNGQRQSNGGFAAENAQTLEKLWLAKSVAELVDTAILDAQIFGAHAEASLFSSSPDATEG